VLGFLAVAFIVVVEAVCWALAFAGPSGTAAFWLLCCLPNVVFGIGSLVYAGSKGLLGAWLELNIVDLVLGVGVAALQYALAYAVARGLLPRLSEGTTWLTDLYDHLGGTSSRQAHPVLSLFGLFATCSCEEIVWRGLATEVATPRFGGVGAFVFQVVANAVLYVPMAIVSQNPIIPCSALVGGIATGLLAARRDGRLPGTFVGHSLFDFSVVVLWPLVA
jgi:membrane protease YdiL (CAAX protease family)